MNKYQFADPDATLGSSGEAEYYLASEVDARIAELEKALREHITHDPRCSIWAGDMDSYLSKEPDPVCNCSAAAVLKQLGL